MKFKNFDKRGYPTVNPKTGYGEWADTYESTVPDLLDIKIFDSLESVNWSESQKCLDLACGTGRIGQFLQNKGLQNIDGLDLTPEMLDLARTKNLYEELNLGSVEETNLPANEYDLITMSLVDEHLPNLMKVYQEAARLSQEGAIFIVVGIHPFFLMNGMPTHYDDKDGNPKAIETYIHLPSHHFTSATSSGWKLIEFVEGVIDEDWVQLKPKWEKFRDCPINFGYVWKI